MGRAAPLENRFLFNFSASYSGGGHKRLQAYARWFAARGGAWFAIHPRCAQLIDEFPQNRFFIVSHSHLRRLVDDWSYLERIVAQTGRPDLYYAYGIPLYRPVGQVNWSHLNNILTVHARGVPLTPSWRMKFLFLGRRLRRGMAHAQVVSAESNYSLGRLRAWGLAEPVLSLNGADDELAALRTNNREPPRDTAVVVGTYTYRALDESYHVFQMLRQDHARLRLLIIGDPRAIPAAIRRDAAVEICGELPRAEVLRHLRTARFFINTTYAENSYNCAAEGICLARESYVSAIAPHRELLLGEPCDRFDIAGLDRQLLHVERERMRGLNLLSWEQIILAMTARVHEELQLAQRRNAPLLPVASPVPARV